MCISPEGIVTNKRQGSHGTNNYIEALVAQSHCKPYEHSSQQVGFDRELTQLGQRQRYKRHL